MTSLAAPQKLNDSHNMSESTSPKFSADEAENRATALCQAAREMGFDAAGICSAELADDDKNAWLQYLQAGHHAGMDYLEQSRDLRAAGARSLLADAHSVLLVARSYHQPELDKKRPAIARYALGKDYHKTLRSDLARLMKNARLQLDLQGNYRLCVDTAPLLERAYARQAGLGWIGRNGMLVSQQLGSYTFLAAVLLQDKLPRRSAFPPESLIGCGACRACVTSCPVGAITEAKTSSAGLNPPGHVDTRRCISYWTIEHRGPFNGDTPDYDRWIFGCDRCQEVCPLNHKARPSTDPRLQARAKILHLSPAQISAMDDAALTAQIAGSPVRRAKPLGLRRNVKRLLAVDFAETITDELDKHTNNK